MLKILIPRTQCDNRIPSSISSNNLSAQMLLYTQYNLHAEEQYLHMQVRERYLLQRDEAFFKLLCHTGDRDSDIGKIKVDKIQWRRQRKDVYD